jgi:hypothetical protein
VKECGCSLFKGIVMLLKGVSEEIHKASLHTVGIYNMKWKEIFFK